MRLALVALIGSAAAASLGAQSAPLQVLRHMPADTASPGSVITVTFDRPVAGRLEDMVPAERVFHVAPATPGQVAWRDPITIRFVPDEPLLPGSSYAITVDTSFRAIDGSRLATPYRFTFRVPGPRILARDFEQSGYYGILPVNGRIRLVYSAPIDAQVLAQGARVELQKCTPALVRFRFLGQREIAESDPYTFQQAGGWERDTLADRFRRVVELEPETPLPLECGGRLVLPSTPDDTIHGREESFPVRTAARFRLAPLRCAQDPGCPPDNLVLVFTSPVKREDVERFVRLDPDARISFDAHVSQDWTWNVKIRLRPRTTYTVTVSDSLRDIHGRALEGPRTTRLITGDFQPALSYPVGHITVARSGPRTIPLRHINVTSVRVVSYRIPETHRSRVVALRSLDELRALGLAADTSIVDLESTRNTEATTQLPLPASIATGGSALYALRVDVVTSLAPRDTSARNLYPGFNRWGWDIPIVQITDLAVHAKLAPGQGMVLVTGLTDGRPRQGARVRHVTHDGAVVAEGTTGADGVARLAPPADLPVVPDFPRRPIADDWPPRFGLVEVTLGDDRVVPPLTVRRLGYEPVNPIQPASLGARVALIPAATATIFADRDIYRPGEMLYLKGVVRYGVLGALTVPPTADSVRIKVSYRSLPTWLQNLDDDEDAALPGSPDGDVLLRDTILRVSALGSVADSFRLRPGLPLGAYVAELQVVVGSDWSAVAWQRLRIAEYRAPEFLVDASIDSAQRALRGGDTLRVRVNGRYLFGAPMGHAGVRWTAVLRESPPWDVRIPGAEGWTVGAWDWWSGTPAQQRHELAGDDSLDAGGRLTLALPLSQLRATRPGRVTLDVAVTDINRQAVGASVTATVHPTDHYILARHKARSWFWRDGERATIELRTVRPDGSALPGVRVVATAVLRDWRGGPRGWVEDTLLTDTIATRDSITAYTFVPRGAGWYDLRFAAVDGRGGMARTTLGGYVVGTGMRAWGSQPSLRLPLVVERRELDAGEETSIAFESPYDSADVWFTVERERVLEQRQLTARRGTNVVSLRLAQQHIPNVFVSVMLRRRGQASQPPDSISELLRIGYAELRVKTSRKRLALLLEPQKTEYGPGDTAVVRVRVRDAAGRGVRGEVALWAVDEGVLALTGFETPDLLARMYEPRGLGVGLWSTLPTMLTSDPGHVTVLLRGAATALSEVVVTGLHAEHAPISATREPTMRSRFRATAFFLSSVRTDANGVATARARLPDNLTTFRLMAVALDDGDRFGSRDTTLLVTRPLVARPGLPRFVRPSDTLHAGATVNARDGRERPVDVEATGFGIRLMGEQRRDLRLGVGKGVEARFDWAVPSRDSTGDSVAVRLHASDGTNADAVEMRLPVRPDFHPRAHTRMGMLRQATDVVLDLSPGTDPAKSTVSIRFGNSPLAPMLAAYDRLRAYPYHCTEQIASGGRALIAISRALRDRAPRALGGDPRPRLQELADAIARRQLPGGGIRYWDDYDWTSPWLSAYAGLFLLEARDAGVDVNAITLQRLSAFLTSAASAAVDTGGMNRFERRDRRLALGDRVAVLDYLRRAGMPAVEAEDALLAVASAMTWEDRLRLAEVIASRDDRRAEASALVDAAWRAVVTAGKRVDLPDSAHAAREFPSRIAPAARLLTASLAVRPEHPWIGGLVETVLQHGRAEGRWAWSTQDYASVVLAVAALPAASDGERTVQVLSRGKKVARRAVTSAAADMLLPLGGMLEEAEGKSRLRLRLQSDGGATPLYFAVTVTEVPARPPVTPDMKGMVVERWYERFEDGKPVTTVQEGDLVRVRLRVSVPADRQYVALEDPLPAGLEPLDLSLRTTALKPFVTPESEEARLMGDRDRDGPRWQSWLYGRWDDGWWSPWEHRAMHDDRVVFFARMLWSGSYTATYVVRATTAGTFVRPPAHAEEMYNPALQGRTDGGRFVVRPKA